MLFSGSRNFTVDLVRADTEDPEVVNSVTVRAEVSDLGDSAEAGFASKPPT